jgi:hypothetical protein
MRFFILLKKTTTKTLPTKSTKYTQQNDPLEMKDILRKTKASSKPVL